MTKQQIAFPLREREWYVIPSYRVMLVRDSGVQASERPCIRTPDDIADILTTHLDGLDREVFMIALVDTKHRVIGVNTVSVGTLNSAQVHPREVFKPAIVMGAAAIILAHNHPSGDTTPSQDDITLTERLVSAGNLLGIKILDHIIIGDGYTSFRAEGLIK